MTVQGMEGLLSGLYDDSPSDPSDSSRTEIPDDLFSVYKNMSKEVRVLYMFSCIYSVYFLSAGGFGVGIK